LEKAKDCDFENINDGSLDLLQQIWKSDG